MSSKRKYGIGGDNYDNSWMGRAFLWVIAVSLLIAAGLCALASCSPRIITQTETVIEYRDRVVHDTTSIEIPYEVEKVVTRDTSSHLENTYAKSDAVVSGGLLHHSLESKPQIVRIPVEVHVTDTVKVTETSVETIKEVEIEKPLSAWRKFEIGAFWWLLGALALCLLWTFRKVIF